MTRIAGWQHLLAQVHQAAAGKAFEWGRHDCCQFAASCAAAITGDDGRARFPAYDSEESAAAILAEHGGMRGLLTYAFGEPVHPSHASLGDILLVDMGAGEQPAVCMGFNCFAPGRLGLEHRPTSMAVLAWII